MTLWYVAYGSNLSLERFQCYLVGGRPAGAARTYPGCRDRRPARDVRSLQIPGVLYFAGRSTVWGGGMAFLDPVPERGPVAGGRTVAARAYLLSREQFDDVMRQEMHGVPAAVDPTEDAPTDERHDPLMSLADGDQLTLGPGRYETVVRIGTLEGRPLLTFTAPTSSDAVFSHPARPTCGPWSRGFVRPTAGRQPRSPPTSTTAPVSGRTGPPLTCWISDQVDDLQPPFRFIYRGPVHKTDHLTIGEVAERSGVAPSALRFYEAEGLLTSTRTTGNQRRYERSTLRRIAFIRSAQRVGLTLDEITAALATLPGSRTPTKADWTRLSHTWRSRVEEQIERLERLRDSLDGCIGCGCLSLLRCSLQNPADEVARSGSGARFLEPTVR